MSCMTRRQGCLDFALGGVHKQVLVMPNVIMSLRGEGGSRM